MTSHLIEQMVASAIGNNSISAQTSNYSVAQINNNLWNACPCGADHNADQHQSVMEGMPTDPVELVNDLMRMGHYSDRAQLMAQSWETNAMKADLWQLLEQGSLSHASESQKRICYDLIKMAGVLRKPLVQPLVPKHKSSLPIHCNLVPSVGANF